jgi:hypothetical protein
MEMHQVRCFLAVARTLNFTRAAEECHVAQPSLTRAIKLLEGELGGDLFRRERPRAMLTPLGERMFPLLKQCMGIPSRLAVSCVMNCAQPAPDADQTPMSALGHCAHGVMFRVRIWEDRQCPFLVVSSTGHCNTARGAM